MTVGPKLVSYVLKEEMNLVYKQTKKVAPKANEPRCLVLRQQFALSLLALLDQGKRIINVDETWLAETNFQRKTWCRPLASATTSSKPITPSLAVITALDTDGRVYFTLSHANTDQDTFMLFMRYLVQHLKRETPGW